MHRNILAVLYPVVSLGKMCKTNRRQVESPNVRIEGWGGECDKQQKYHRKKSTTLAKYERRSCRKYKQDTIKWKKQMTRMA